MIGMYTVGEQWQPKWHPEAASLYQVKVSHQRYLSLWPKGCEDFGAALSVDIDLYHSDTLTIRYRHIMSPV